GCHVSAFEAWNLQHTTSQPTEGCYLSYHAGRNSPRGSNVISNHWKNHFITCDACHSICVGLLIHTEAKNFISVITLNHFERLALARKRRRIFLCIHSMD